MLLLLLASVLRLHICLSRQSAWSRTLYQRSRSPPSCVASTSGQLLCNDLGEFWLLQAVDLFVVLVHLAGPVHAAELWPAHAAEGSFLVIVVGQRFVVHAAGGFGAEREVELRVPVEAVTGVRDRVVTIASAGA